MSAKTKVIDPVDEFLVDLFLIDQLYESQWQCLAKHFETLVREAKGNLAINWNYGVRDPDKDFDVRADRAYVQIRPGEDTLELEAVSSRFLKNKLSNDAVHSLIELGWIGPEVLDDCPNFSRRFEKYELDYVAIGQFVMNTFRHGYGCVLGRFVDIGPTWLDSKYPLRWEDIK